MRFYLPFLSLLSLNMLAEPISGRLIDPNANPVAMAHVELLCGTVSVAVESDLSGYFKIDIHDDVFPGVASAAPPLRRDLEPSHTFCDLRITAPFFRPRSLVTNTFSGASIGSVVLQPVRPQGGTVSKNAPLAPHGAMARREKAQRFSARQRFADAEGELKKAVAEYENYGPAWVDLGCIQLRDGRFPEAVASFESAVAAGEKTVTLYYALASGYARLKQWSSVVRWCDEALQLPGGRRTEVLQLRVIGQRSIAASF